MYDVALAAGAAASSQRGKEREERITHLAIKAEDTLSLLISTTFEAIKLSTT